MKPQKLNLKSKFDLAPSPAPPKKRSRKGRKAVFPNTKIRGNTMGLQLNLWPYKGQQLTIGDIIDKEEE